MLWWILVISLAVLYYVKIWKRQQYWKEKHVPHDKPLPIVGNMLEALLQKIPFAESLLKNSQKYKNYRYYGIYQLWMPTLVVHDIDLIKQITIKDFDSFTDHLTFASDKVDPLFANSLIMVKGQKWRHIRSTLSPAFTSSKMRLMFNLMSECAEQFTEYFVKNAEPNQHTTVEMKDIFTRYANDVIATCAFGVKCDSLTEQNNEFYVMGKRATDFDGINGLKMFGYTVSQSIMEFFNIRLHELDIQDFFRNLVLSTMETREKQGIIRPDMIHLLMQARKGNLKHEENAVKEDTGFATVEESHIGKERNKNIGQKWRHIRSTLSPAFTSSKMRLMFNLMSECAEQFTEYFVKNAEPNQHTTVEMKDIFTRYANDVIATCAFGVKCDSLTEQNNEFYVMGKRATDFDGINGLKMFGYTVSQSIMEFFNIRLHELDIQDFFRNLVLSTMETREKQGIIRPDMIHLLMQARKGNLKHEENAVKEDTGFATVEESHIGKERNKNIDLSDDDLTAQALAFFFAGFDSSSTLLAHLAHELAVNPDIQEKLQLEIDETLQHCKNNKITYDAILKMKYMDMVVSETLRKWAPSAVTTRICTKQYVIEPVLPEEKQLILEKGDIVFIPLYAIHHNPEYFPNPERFDPERFSDGNKDNIKPMSYIPFGAGPRNCIGSRFALLETKTLIIHLLSKFNIVVDEKTQIPLRLSKTNFNMTAEKGFWLGL